MLAVLRIENLAIIDETEVEFTPGLNALTGETGAGKSIIFKSIELLSGKRSSSDIIRAGADRCIVEGLFILNDTIRESLSAHSEQLEEFAAEEELLIRRVIDKSGRSKIYLNGNLSTATILQQVSRCLIDVTGQHQQHTLLESSSHRSLLDEFGVAKKSLDAVAELYATFSAAERELKRFQENSQEQRAYYERIRIEHEELESASLQEGERALAEEELERLANFEGLTAKLSECLELLEGDQGSIESPLRECLHLLQDCLRIDSTLQEATSLVESAVVQLEESRLSVNEYMARLESDPGRLEELRERIAEIAKLERRYQRDLSGLIIYRDSIAEEIANFEAGGLDEQKLRERRDAARKSLDSAESALTAERKLAGERLSKMVVKELAALNMKRARFSVEVSEGTSGPQGADKIEFTLAANPGEAFRPLAKVASGGELSRILLVLKTLLNETKSAATQIFDEIDSGIGGAVAQVVGERLLELAQHRQVFLITHAPQIAALADTQFEIQKSTNSSRTSSTIKRLSREERVEHIARMLAGKNVSSQFEDSARALLAIRDSSSKATKSKKKAIKDKGHSEVRTQTSGK
jgi:DNA repair protein RecN (Recombination protein N)